MILHYEKFEFVKSSCFIGSPGAGKSTLGDLLTKRCPVQHVSVGNLLRRIKDDGTDPQAEVIASQLSRQELINAKVLVPILKAELDKLRLQNPARPVILVDGFPRNMAQLMEFETEVKKNSRVCCNVLL